MSYTWTLLTLAADQTVTNSSTLVDVTGLSFAVAAGGQYVFRCEIYFDTTAAGDYAYKLAAPASPTLVRINRFTVVAAGGTPQYNTALGSSVTNAVGLTGTGTTGGYVLATGIFQNGVNAGTFKLQFAQNAASNDSGAVTLAGTRLEYIDLSVLASTGYGVPSFY